MEVEIIKKKQEFAPITISVTFTSWGEIERLHDCLGDVAHSSELYHVLGILLNERDA